MPEQLDLADPLPEVPKRDLIKEAIEVIDFLHSRTGKNYRYFNADGTPTASLRMVRDRLKSGATVQDCKTLIARKASQWRGDWRKYVRIKTLFGPVNFEEYLAECVVPKEKT